MKSIIRRITDIETAKRWDFDFHDPEYLALLASLDKTYPTVSFGDIITLLTDMGAFSLYKTEFFVDQGIPFLRVQNVQEYGIDLSKDTKYISNEYHKQLTKSQLKPNDLLLTTKAVIGVSAVVTEDLGECNISQNLVRIQLKAGINPNYISVFLNSKLGRVQSETASTGANQRYLNFQKIRKIKITLPPRPVQDEIAQVMQDAYAIRREKLEEANRLLQNIDGSIFERLNIFPQMVEEKKQFLKPISEIVGGRFDVEFNMGFHKFDPYLDQVSKIENVVVFPNEKYNPSTEPDKLFNYINISNIDTDLGEVNEVLEIIGSDAPSRARQVVHTGDVIVSTVRPTRGAVAQIPENMNNFICSTGFCILCPKEQITSQYLHTALRLSTTLEQFGRRSSGSSYPAILERDIRETLIPVPSKQVQDEITNEVNRRRTEAKHLRTEAEAVVTKAKAKVERMILGEAVTEAN